MNGFFCLHNSINIHPNLGLSQIGLLRRAYAHPSLRRGWGAAKIINPRNKDAREKQKGTRLLQRITNARPARKSLNIYKIDFNVLLDPNAVHSVPAVVRWSGLSYGSPARSPSSPVSCRPAKAGLRHGFGRRCSVGRKTARRTSALLTVVQNWVRALKAKTRAKGKTMKFAKYLMILIFLVISNSCLTVSGYSQYYNSSKFTIEDLRYSRVIVFATNSIEHKAASERIENTRNFTENCRLFSLNSLHKHFLKFKLISTIDTSTNHANLFNQNNTDSSTFRIIGNQKDADFAIVIRKMAFSKGNMISQGQLKSSLFVESNIEIYSINEKKYVLGFLISDQLERNSNTNPLTLMKSVIDLCLLEVASACSEGKYPEYLQRP